MTPRETAAVLVVVFVVMALWSKGVNNPNFDVTWNEMPIVPPNPTRFPFSCYMAPSQSSGAQCWGQTHLYLYNDYYMCCLVSPFG